MKRIAIIVVAVVLSGCTVSKVKATDALEGQGYHDVKLGWVALWGCSDGDKFSRTWKATGQNGKRYKGVVCAGWLKGATVRQQGSIRG